jgi:hypothetical protein
MYEIIPQNLSIVAMRDSGYKDTDYALAELIDNSIQAGLQYKSVNVEVVCIDKTETRNDRTIRQIDKIMVFDNASGMNEQTLRQALQFGNGTHLDSRDQKGIGKFGMGLPNSSISQCRRADVWSWQGGKTLHSFLDIAEISSGRLTEVPKPQRESIPEEYTSLIKGKIGAHGSLVVWSILDKVKWKSSKVFLAHAEHLIGRMYRHFINDKSVTIRLASYDRSGNNLDNKLDNFARSNDPLYLMRNTAAAEWLKQPAFDYYCEDKLVVKFKGVKSEIKIKCSIAKIETRDDGGAEKFGKHAARNLGISLVRANRELQLDTSFNIGYDPLERWWGLEVAFEPELDEVFGVTNNKQSAIRFGNHDLQTDALNVELSQAEFKEQLIENDDPMLAMYELSTKIRSLLGPMRDQISRMGKGKRGNRKSMFSEHSAEGIASRGIEKRRELLGDKAKSTTDKNENLSKPEKEKEIFNTLVKEGIDSKSAKVITDEVIKTKLKVIFQYGDVTGGVFFDVKPAAGTNIIIINSKHPLSKHLKQLTTNNEGEEVDTPTLIALKLMLAAWARIEDEAMDNKKEAIEDLRLEWGRLTRDFLKEMPE